MRISSLAIAVAAHEANRVYCQSIGDDSQLPWIEAPEEARQSAIAGVHAILAHEIASPEAAHEAWMARKIELGWTFGEVKDFEAKTHPCLVPYAELPTEQRVKDALFFAIVTSLRDGVIA